MFFMKHITGYIIATVTLLASGCSVTGSDDIPLGVTGYNVYLFDSDKAPNGDRFVGKIETSYLSRKDNLDRARRLAFSEAKRLQFDVGNPRYYIICTETNDSTCATKIR